MARKNGYLERYAEVGGLKESLERIYTGQANVARETSKRYSGPTWQITH
jgi:hypothetical protein